jgi:hypothetical protein
VQFRGIILLIFILFEEGTKNKSNSIETVALTSKNTFINKSKEEILFN